jgi:putative Holliday junction resolvase
MSSLSVSEFRSFLASSIGPVAGIDVGERRTGLAVSDTRRRLALPWKLISHHSLMSGVAPVASCLLGRDVVGAVIGWPIEMSGRVGAQCEKVLKFAEALSEQTAKAFFLWDERLSTAAVAKYFYETKTSHRRYAEKIDQEVAVHLLQGALDFLKISVEP